MQRFWPGPLSLGIALFEQAAAGGQRRPAHGGGAHARSSGSFKPYPGRGVPIAAPSANRSGRPSPTTLRHVLEDLAGRIDAVLDGGACRLGLESTVLDLSGGRPVILRPGGITGEQLEAVLGTTVEVAEGCKTGAPPSPGMKYRHYAPRATLFLVTGARRRRLALMAALAECYQKKGLKVGILQALRDRKLSGRRQSASTRHCAALMRREWT